MCYLGYRYGMFRLKRCRGWLCAPGQPPTAVCRLMVEFRNTHGYIWKGADLGMLR